MPRFELQAEQGVPRPDTLERPPLHLLGELLAPLFAVLLIWSHGAPAWRVLAAAREKVRERA